MNLFACPLCSERLTRAGGALRCCNSHSFDLAREGYVNLLPSHHRRSKNPGDNAEMVAARGRFLELGHYQPLQESLMSTIDTARLAGPVVDLGCGEGYFTAALSRNVSPVYGIDVSKPAVKAASKRSESLSLAVASSSRLPLVAQTFAAATVLMAPISHDVLRILVPGGLLYRVTPAPDHLDELKRIVYREARPHRRAKTVLPEFVLTGSQRVTFQTPLTMQSRGDLLGMTPMRFRSAYARQVQASVPEQLSITADFWIDVFTKL